MVRSTSIGAGSRILDVDAQVHEDEITRLATFGKDRKDPAGGIERGLTAKEIDTFMAANLKRAGDAARWYYPMLMKGEWPVLLKILGKGEGERALPQRRRGQDAVRRTAVSRPDRRAIQAIATVVMPKTGTIALSDHLNSGVPGTKASNAAQNCAR